MLRIADVNGVPVRAILFTIFAVVGLYLAGQVLFRLRTLLIIGLLSGFIALILNPLVVVLERWKIKRRGVAVAIVTVLALLVFFGLALAFGYPLVNGLTHFANSLPSYIDKAQHGRGWIGHLIRRYHVQDWVQRNSAKITSIATGLGKPALALGKGAVSILLMLFGVFTFVVLLLVEAPKMRRGLITMLEPERAARFTRIGSAVSSSVSGYILGDLLTSLSAGVVVFVTLLTLALRAALRPVGRTGRLPADDRRCPRGHPDRPLRLHPLDLGGGRHGDRLPALHPGGEPRPEPVGDEPHGQDQPAARLLLGADRRGHRRVARRVLRRLRGGPARRAGRGIFAGRRSGVLAHVGRRRPRGDDDHRHEPLALRDPSCCNGENLVKGPSWRHQIRRFSAHPAGST
jgi:hypothetical protein